MTVSTNRTYLPALDHLRAYAAILVIFYHGSQLIGGNISRLENPGASAGWIRTNNPLWAMVVEGHTGVGLFIVLSGFILSLNCVDRRISYGKFIQARALRIFPLVITLAVLSACITQSDLWSFVQTCLAFHRSVPSMTNFTVLSWAVGVELQCYLVFPFILKFTNERGSFYIVRLIAIVLILRWLAASLGGVNARDLSYWTIIGRLDQFCIGMFAARIYTHSGAQSISRYYFPASAALVLGLITTYNHLGGWPAEDTWKVFWPCVEGIAWAFLTVSYLSFAASLPKVLSRPLAAIGTISFSMYLLHSPIIALLTSRSIYIHAGANAYVSAILTTAFIVMPAVIALSCLTYSTIEAPFLRMRARYTE